VDVAEDMVVDIVAVMVIDTSMDMVADRVVKFIMWIQLGT
jgi:hypothetical protein